MSEPPHDLRPKAITNQAAWDIYVDPEVPALASQHPDIFDEVEVLGVAVLGIAYDSRVFPEPPSWQDLITPALEGRIALKDARTIPRAAFATWAMLQDAFGEDYLRSVGKLRPRTYPNGSAALDALARGECGVALCMPRQAMATLPPDTQVRWTRPSPASGADLYIAVSARAPSSLAARQMTAFLQSDAGSRLWNTAAGDISPTDAGALVDVTRDEGNRGDAWRSEVASVVGFEW